MAPWVFQDLGNLLLAFVMLWAYTSFSQFLLIWVENLSTEIPGISTGRWEAGEPSPWLYWFFSLLCRSYCCCRER